MAIYWIDQQIDTTGDAVIWSKRSPEIASIQVSGTFDGALLQLEISQDQLPFHVLDSYSASAPGITSIVIPFNCRFRFLLSNSGASTSVSVSVMGGGR